MSALPTEPANKRLVHDRAQCLAPLGTAPGSTPAAVGRQEPCSAPNQLQYGPTRRSLTSL